MPKTACFKQHGRPHLVQEDLESSAQSGQLLYASCWARFQNVQHLCYLACARLFVPILSLQMYVSSLFPPPRIRRQKLSLLTCTWSRYIIVCSRFERKRNFLTCVFAEMIRFLIFSLWAPCWQAVRIGDLELFRSVAERNAAVFATDKSQNLIVRLRHNVIRTGLRNISISYSRISLADVAQKLHLDSATAVDDAESIVTKAIRDGGIDASVDHSKGWMQSKETGDIYSTQVWLFNWEVYVLLQSKSTTFSPNKWLIQRIYSENLVVIPFLDSCMQKEGIGGENCVSISWLAECCL